MRRGGSGARRTTSRIASDEAGGAETREPADGVPERAGQRDQRQQERGEAEAGRQGERRALVAAQVAPARPDGRASERPCGRGEQRQRGQRHEADRAG